MAYLVFGLILASALTWYVLWRSRRPKSMASGIREFSRGLQAIAPRGAQRDPGPSGAPDESGDGPDPGTGDGPADAGDDGSRG